MNPGNNEDKKDEEGTPCNGEEKYRGHNTILIWSFAADHDGGGPQWSATEPEDDRRRVLLEADHARASAHATVGPRPRTWMDASRPSSHSTAMGGWPKGVLIKILVGTGKEPRGKGERDFQSGLPRDQLNYS